METTNRHVSYRNWLQNQFQDRRKRNPNYSLRAFARTLKIPASSLSQLLLGKRPLTLKAALKIADRFDISPRERQEFLQSVIEEKTSVLQLSQKEQRYQELENETFTAISDWYHYGILSLGEIKPNYCDPVWVSDQLGISRREAKDALERLFKLGLLKKVGRGFKQCTGPLDIQSPNRSLALRKYHRQNLQMAENALDNEPMDFRDFNSITMAIDVSKIPEAKKAIKRFRDEIADILESGNPSRVYTLAIQLFPISKIQKKEISK